MPGVDPAELFGEVYRTGRWGGGSGGGSDPHRLTEYIALVERLLLELKPTRVLDVGCGLGWLAGAIRWGHARYIGIDVVPEVIAEARRNFPVGGYLALDAVADVLPDADLVILKEVTQHLHNDTIEALLQNLAKFPAVLHCSYWEPNPNDAPMVAGTRGVDLTAPPFNRKCEHLLTYKLDETEYLCQLWRP